MREIKFSFMWQHQETGRWLDKRYTLDEIIAGDPYDDMSDCVMLKRYHHMETREYAGLKDKNGKEIYEGDILKAIKNCITKEGETIKEVKFERGCFVSGSVELIISVDSFYPEIIGNIYENPELMEGE